jgi:pimeloyl-ACP methyl ester carboxylesterase
VLPRTRSIRAPTRCSSWPEDRSGGELPWPFAAALTGVRKDRDIVLVDQRGTGRSSPLTCAAFKPDDSPDATSSSTRRPGTGVRERARSSRRRRRAVHTAAWIADLERCAMRSATPR